jgi:DNA-binding transcriptional MocR family regulator
MVSKGMVAVEGGMKILMPFDLIRDPNISVNAKMAYAAIRTHAPNAYPAINTVAEYMGVSRRTAERAISEIEKSGWITVKYRATEKGQQSNLYTCMDKPRKRRTPPHQ